MIPVAVNLLQRHRHRHVNTVTHSRTQTCYKGLPDTTRTSAVAHARGNAGRPKTRPARAPNASRLQNPVAPTSRRAGRRTQHSLRVGPQPGRHPDLHSMHLGRHQHVRPEGKRRRTGRPTHPRRDRTQEAFKGKTRASQGQIAASASRLLRASWRPWLHREDAGCGARRTLQRVRRVARIATAHAVDA